MLNNTIQCFPGEIPIVEKRTKQKIHFDYIVSSPQMWVWNNKTILR